MSTATHVYPHFVSPSTAARTFSVSLQTLRRWARNGQISYIRTPGGRFKYDIAGLIVAAGPAKAAPARPAPAPAAAPKAQKPAKANKEPVQHKNELEGVLQAETPALASAPAPEPESPPVAFLEPAAATFKPEPERVMPKPPLNPEALRSQFASLAGASKW